MSDYEITSVYLNDTYMLKQVDALLAEDGLRRDTGLDYICAVVDDDFRVIGTGSCRGNTLRCFAVSPACQGEGLLNKILSHLIQVQYERGNIQLFLYAKVTASRFFKDLGFYEIARVENRLVFMTNRRNGFSDYLKNLSRFRQPGRSGAIVMNANPFTLGHQHLVEAAAAECDTLHLFVISEDASLVPFQVRKKLIADGTAHLKNVIIHESGPYIISNATFPSYFLKDENTVIESHARLDLAIFTRIAEAMDIRVRYVGQEPNSRVTHLYNTLMAELLPKAGIECIVLPRLSYTPLRRGAGAPDSACAPDSAGASNLAGSYISANVSNSTCACDSAHGSGTDCAPEVSGQRPISASDVRRAIQEDDWETLRILVPDSTYDYFTSPEAAPVVKKIKAVDDVKHY